MNDFAIAYNKTSHTQQSTTHPTSNYSFYLLKNLSSTAKYLYIELRRIAGPKGYLSYSVTDLSEIVDRSIKQTRRLLHELEANGLLEIWLHPGRESEYVIPDVYFRQGMDINVQTFKKKSYIKKTVRKANGVSLSIVKPDPKIQSDPHEAPELSASEQTASEPAIEPKEAHNMGESDQVQAPTPTRAKPIRMDLVKEILDLTQDTKSTRFWIKFVRQAPLAVVYCAISSLKSALAEGIVQHPGRYMVGIIKRIYPELFDPGKTPLRPSQQKTAAHYYPKAAQKENTPMSIDWDLNQNGLKQIQKILNGSTYE